MGMAAAPAAGTAFGTSALAASAPVYTSIAASAALPTVTSMAAGPLAGASSSMFMNSAFLSPGTALRAAGGGGLLSGFTLEAARPWLYALGTGSSIINTLNQGQYRKSMYEIQDLELQANIEMKKLNAVNASIDRMKEIHRINAANLAKAYGGGVVGLDGSTKLLETVSGKEYGRDYQIATLDLANDLVAGNVQSDIYKATQEQVVNGSVLDAASKFGTATYLYGRLGGNPFA